MNADYEFTDGFDKYGSSGLSLFVALGTLPAQMAGEWSSLIDGGSIAIAAALIGSGTALSFACRNATNSQSASYIRRALPGNYARVIAGSWFSSNLSGNTTSTGFALSDGLTDQLTICLNTSGQVEVRRGGPNGSNGVGLGTLIATSSETIAANTSFHLGFDMVCHPTAGVIKVYINGILSANLNLSSQNTRSSANSYFNMFSMFGYNVNNSFQTATYDHLFAFFYLASGGGDSFPANKPAIITSIASADQSVIWTPGQGLIGDPVKIVTSAPNPNLGNFLILRPYTASSSGTLSSLTMLFGSLNNTIKAKCCIYADSGGVPGALISDGVEVIGTNLNVYTNYPLASPPSVVAGTQYWIGWYSDTNVNIYVSDNTTPARTVARTYTSGAPNPAGVMAGGKEAFMIFGYITGVSSGNYGQLGQPNATTIVTTFGDVIGNQTSTVNNKDLFTFPALPATAQTIITTAVKAFSRVIEGGARTVDFKISSGGTESSGATAGLSLAGTYAWAASYADQDPHVASDWTPTTYNASYSGIKISL